jgi:hypothetical protein
LAPDFKARTPGFAVLNGSQQRRRHGGSSAAVIECNVLVRQQRAQPLLKLGDLALGAVGEEGRLALRL